MCNVSGHTNIYTNIWYRPVENTWYANADPFVHIHIMHGRRSDISIGSTTTLQYLRNKIVTKIFLFQQTFPTIVYLRLRLSSTILLCNIHILLFAFSVVIYRNSKILQKNTMENKLYRSRIKLCPLEILHRDHILLLSFL